MWQVKSFCSLHWLRQNKQRTIKKDKMYTIISEHSKDSASVDDDDNSEDKRISC
jgi:hypothetical protein